MVLGLARPRSPIIYMALGPARPRILLFIWLWALQGPEYYYLYGSGPRKAQSTIIYMVLGLARPRVLLLIGSGPCKAQRTIIYMALGLARPRVLLFIWFWALQGPEYYY